MVNVGNGNLLVQANDVDISERGIDLAFQRTYNSQSGHDYSGTDGSVPSNFGNGWTNTFDAHIAFYNNGATLSVYDIDGGRYDYTADSGTWMAPPGKQGTELTLATEVGYNNNCFYQWIKKDGVAYVFYAPDYNTLSCAPSGIGTGLNGRIAEIFGRNSNNAVKFNYAWQGGTVESGYLGSITAAHTDGQQLLLSFALTDGRTACNGSGPCELQSIMRPDGQTIAYVYDSSGDLVQVNHPGNNSSTTLWETYDYAPGSSELTDVASPRYTYSYQQTGGNPTDGTTTNFGYVNGTKLLQYIQRDGVVNFVPSDGSGLVLQPGISTGVQRYYQVNFSYATSETQLTDTDGRATNWLYDGMGRVNETDVWTGAPNNLWLTSYVKWDSSNNLTQFTDARGDVTNYSYDGKGNVTAIQAPEVTTSLGQGNPIARYAYDQHNNLIAYCDPQYVWTTGATQCNPGSGVAYYTYDSSDSAEIYGRLTDAYTPLGYHVHIAYDAASEAGVDAGLPTMVQGHSYTQADGTSRQPTQSFVYDSNGNVTAYNTGSGIWSLSYDPLDRLLVATDPDNVSSYTCYYENGQVRYTENEFEHIADGSPSSCQVTSPTAAAAYSYDADGNTVSTVNLDRSKTQNWYDGLGRLVETQYPLSSSATEQQRYLYDLTQGGTVSLSNGPAMSAYGGLYAVEHNGLDLRGWAYDALGRATKQYLYPPGANSPTATTQAYDSTSTTYGLLDTRTDALGNIKTTSYDAMGRPISVTFNDNGVTPGRSYTYDPDGRISSLSSLIATDSFQYDADGRTTADTQNIAGAGGSETLTYTYYPDGLRQALSVSGIAGNQSNLETYAYRPDGVIQYEGFTDGSYSAKFSWNYSAAGRETNFTDPYFSRNKTYDAYGWLNSDQIPNGSYSNFTYNDLGEVVSFTAYGGVNGLGQAMNPSIIGITYDDANQLVGIDYNSIHPGMGESMVSCGIAGAGNFYQPSASDCDPRTYALLSNGTVAFNNGTKTTYAYDAAGRQATSSYSWSYNDTCEKWTGSGYYTEPCTISGSYSYTRIFDADNHLIGGQPESVKGPDGVPWTAPPDPYITSTIPPPAWNGGTTTATQQLWYGPDGHLVRGVGGGYTYYDGGQPVFSSLAGGVSVGNFAAYGPINGTIGLMVFDRDFTGNIAARHDASGYSGWSPTVASGQGIECSACAPLTAKEFVPDYFPRGSSSWDNGDSTATATTVDGIPDGLGNVLQGARSYDPSLGNWTAPDAFQGVVGYPASFMPYMWDNDNPIAYADPSGYCVHANGVDDHSGKLCTIATQIACSSPSKPPCGTWTDAEIENVKGATNTIEGEQKVLTGILASAYIIRPAVRRGAWQMLSGTYVLPEFRFFVMCTLAMIECTRAPHKHSPPREMAMSSVDNPLFGTLIANVSVRRTWTTVPHRSS